MRKISPFSASTKEKELNKRRRKNSSCLQTYFLAPKMVQTCFIYLFIHQLIHLFLRIMNCFREAFRLTTEPDETLEKGNLIMKRHSTEDT